MEQGFQEESEKYLYSQNVTNGLIVDGMQKITDIKVYQMLLFLSEKHRRKKKQEIKGMKRASKAAKCTSG